MPHLPPRVARGPPRVHACTAPHPLYYYYYYYHYYYYHCYHSRPRPRPCPTPARTAQYRGGCPRRAMIPP